MRTTKEFDIEVPFDEEDSSPTWVNLMDDSSEIIDGDEVVIEDIAIKILFDYPCDSHTREYSSLTGFTRKKLFLLIKKAYENIYWNYDEYHVWGHQIYSLWIEGVKYSEGQVTLRMGS